MSPNRWLVATMAAALLAGAGWTGVRLWRPHQLRALARAAVPPPDTSRWAPVLREKIGRAAAEARSAPEPRPALADLARLYLVNGYPGEAEIVLRALHQLEPANPRWTYYLADVRVKEDDRPAAIALLRETTRLAPDYATALILRGNLLIRERAYAEARECFEASLALSPGDPRVGSNLAFLDNVAGNRPGALARIRAVLQAHPAFGAGHRLHAEFLEQAGDRAGGAEARRRESTCPPFAAPDPWLEELNDFCFDANRLQMITAALCRDGRYADALPYLQRCTELTPDEALFYEGWASACDILGRFEDSRTVLEKGLVAAPDSPVLPVHLALTLGRLNRTDEALAVVERAREKWPKQAELVDARGRVLQLARRPAEAVTAFEAALTLNRGLPETHFNLGRSLMHLDRVEEAVASFTQALQIRPAFTEARMMLAGIALNTGDLAGAETHATRLLEQLPQDPRARRLFAEMQHLRANDFASQGQMAAAEQAYRAGLAADASHPLLHAGLGMVYAATERPQLAVPELRHYAQLAPDDLQAYLVLGNVLTGLNQRDEARQTYERGLAVAEKTGAAEAAAAFAALLKER